MNKIWLRDCVNCGRYIAVKDSQGRIPSIGLGVPVMARRKSFKTCCSKCSSANQRFNAIENNKAYYRGIKTPEVKQHKVNLEISFKVLRNRKRFIQFCEDNNITYNGNKDIQYEEIKNEGFRGIEFPNNII